MQTYQCTICKRIVEYSGTLPKVFPFCSERCQMVDLGKWLSGDYVISRELTDEEIASSKPSMHDDPFDR